MMSASSAQNSDMRSGFSNLTFSNVRVISASPDPCNNFNGGVPFPFDKHLQISVPLDLRVRSPTQIADILQFAVNPQLVIKIL